MSDSRTEDPKCTCKAEHWQWHADGCPMAATGKRYIRDDKWLRVEVTDRDGQIVAIETETLAGRDIGDKERATIERAIKHLESFIGPPGEVPYIMAALDRAEPTPPTPWPGANPNKGNPPDSRGRQ